MAQELLRVEHLSAAYGGIHALHDISLKVEEGEIVAVLGANGMAGCFPEENSRCWQLPAGLWQNQGF